MSVLELVRGNKDDSSGLIAVIEETLREKNWRFRRDEDASIIRTGVNCDNADFNVLFVVREERDLVMFFVDFSPRVPEKRRKEAADYIARANYGLPLGNFELDMEDGQVRFKVSVDVEGGVLSRAMVDNMMGAGITTADRHFPALMSVCFSNDIPSVAIRAVEN